MDKITIIKGNKTFSFAIGKVKYLFGTNFNKKNEIVKTLIKEFKKISNSPYAIEEEQSSVVLINDNKIDYKRIKLLEINNHFDFIDDLKLKTKSLTLQLLETVFYDIEYNDEVSTINILNESLAEYMTTKLENITNEFEFAINFDDLTIKSIVKNLNIKTFKNQNEINQFDMNYENNIVFQIDITNKIAELNKNNDYLVILEVPKLTNIIINKINNINNDNLKFIVCCPEITVKSKIKTNNILSCNKQTIDLSNEIELYNNVLLNLTKRLTIDELNNYLFNYFNEIDQEVDLKLEEIL